MSIEPVNDCPNTTDIFILNAYQELKEVARQYLSGERPGHTLGPTALVHEAYLRLADYKPAELQKRGEFIELIARTMRRILVDHARMKSAEKRGGRLLRISLQEAVTSDSDSQTVNLIELDDALSRLAELNPRHASVVELRYFGGMSVDETAVALDVSEWTVKNDWRLARAWLMTQLRSETSSCDSTD